VFLSERRGELGRMEAPLSDFPFLGSPISSCDFQSDPPKYAEAGLLVFNRMELGPSLSQLPKVGKVDQ